MLDLSHISRICFQSYFDKLISHAWLNPFQLYQLSASERRTWHLMIKRLIFNRLYKDNMESNTVRFLKGNQSLLELEARTVDLDGVQYLEWDAGDVMDVRTMPVHLRNECKTLQS